MQLAFKRFSWLLGGVPVANAARISGAGATFLPMPDAVVHLIERSWQTIVDSDGRPVGKRS
jgi:hypothetical protein